MSFLNPHMRGGRAGIFHGKGLIAHLSERKGLTLDVVMARLFLSALAGVLAIHFWRSGRR